MIEIPVKRLRPGMVTAQSIYNKSGASYLTRGTVIQERYIEKLRELGIPSLAVTSLSAGFQLPPPDDIVQEKTRITAIHTVYETFDACEKFGEVNTAPIEDASESLLVDILSNRGNLVQLTDLRRHDDYTFAHSVNVAILAAVLGSLCHLSKRELSDLVTGSLLHDIGKTLVPADILSKTGNLTKTEYSAVQMHAEAGAEKLAMLSEPSASLWALIAGQHHEHIDGNGYPNHLKGDKIHPLSRMVAIADVYDALTSRRTYKPAYKPHIAYKIMARCSDGQFDPELLDLFFTNVAIYPVGTVMKTTMGYGIVRSTRFGHTLTPTVCIFADKHGNVLSEPYDVNLEDAPSGTILQVVEDRELLPLIYRLHIDPSIFLTNGREKDPSPQIG